MVIFMWKCQGFKKGIIFDIIVYFTLILDIADVHSVVKEFQDKYLSEKNAQSISFGKRQIVALF